MQTTTEAVWLIEVPAELSAAVEAVTVEHLGDITAAKCAAFEAITGHESYGDWLDLLVRVAVGRLVESRRSSLNLIHRRGPDEDEEQVVRNTVGPAKVRALGCAEVRAAWSAYSYAIGGTTLGRLNGPQLEAIAESERRQALGRLLNAELCEWLVKQGVREDTTVADVVSESKLARKLESLRKKHNVDG